MAQMFDAKHFNEEAFARYSASVPETEKLELIKSGVLTVSAEIKNLLGSQTGSFYGVIPMFGHIEGGDPVNYDGQTNIDVEGMDTYKQGVIAYGRAKGWKEKDFSVDITAGVDFMSEVARQIVRYWDKQDTKTLLSIIKGIFSMTGAKNLEFVEKHTHDICDEGDGKVEVTTLNNALQKASGDRKSIFTLVFMHSQVATNLENQKLLTYLKYNDANGIERPSGLATWNGRLVIIDDGLPVEEVPESSPSAGDGYTKYTTFIFGEGAIRYADLGAEVPYEMQRDPVTNGGETKLYTRKRRCFSPYGISFTNKSVATLSPTNAEFENGANWELVNNGQSGAKNKAFPHKLIPIARLYSRG